MCGCVYGEDAWRRLAKIHTLSGDDVRGYVVAWPKGRVVEVRACRTCGRPLARTLTPRGEA